MNILSMYISFFLFIAFFLMSPVYSEPVEVDKELPDIPAGDIHTFHFAPDSGLFAGGGGFYANRADYSFIQERGVDVTVFQYSKISLSFMFKEVNLFGGDHSNRKEPYNFQYFMDYANLSWETKYGLFGFVFDHICFNIINKNETDPQRLRWYGYGVKFMTQGMRPGRRDVQDSPGASPRFSLFQLHYMLYVSKSLHTEWFSYTAFVTGATRLDLIRWYPVIPYIEGSFRALIDDRIRFDRTGEIGLRLHCATFDISPYARYMYRHDVELYNGIKTGFWLVGLQLETLLGEGRWGSAAITNDTALWTPELHFSGNYGRYLVSEYLGYHADLGIYIDLFRFHGLSLFLVNDIAHDSKRSGGGMFPRFLSYIFESGFSYRVRAIEHYIEALYRHEQRHEGNSYNGFSEKIHSLVARLKSRGMKIGFKDQGIGVTGFRMINKWNWELEAGRIVKDRFYDYDWDWSGKVRWDIFGYSDSTFYLEPGVRMRAPGISYEYSAETGLRISSGITIMPFYRYNHRIDIDRVAGATDDNHMLGIRVEK